VVELLGHTERRRDGNAVATERKRGTEAAISAEVNREFSSHSSIPSISAALSSITQTVQSSAGHTEVYGLTNTGRTEVART
jgi:hypothetical protein